MREGGLRAGGEDEGGGGRVCYGGEGRMNAGGKGERGGQERRMRDGGDGREGGSEEWWTEERRGGQTGREADGPEMSLIMLDPSLLLVGKSAQGVGLVL